MGKNDLVEDPRNRKRLIFSWQRDRINVMRSGGPTPDQALEWEREDRAREHESQLELIGTQGKRPGEGYFPELAELRLQEAKARQAAEAVRENRIVEKVARKLRGR